MTKERDISYEEMSEGHKISYEESEVPFHNPPMQNAYEMARNSAFDQSGMK